MKLIKLTSVPMGTVLFVNAEKIVAFDAKPTGTRLVFDEAFAYVVAETVEDILSKLIGCDRAKSE